MTEERERFLMHALRELLHRVYANRTAINVLIREVATLKGVEEVEIQRSIDEIVGRAGLKSLDPDQKKEEDLEAKLRKFLEDYEGDGDPQ